MKKRILFILILGTLLFFTGNKAVADLFPFVNISNNSGVAATLADQFFVDVTSVGSDQVLFKFLNDGGVVSSPIDSVITRIYWDDSSGRLDNFKDFDALTTTTPGVDFSLLTSPPPLNFPEGNTIGFNEDWGVGANPPSPTNGIGLTEMLGVLFYIDSGSTFEDIIADLGNLDMRIGLHVQSIGTAGQSDSFATVPEPATMLLLGSGLIGFAVVRRKKFFKKK